MLSTPHLHEGWAISRYIVIFRNDQNGMAKTIKNDPHMENVGR